MRRGLLLPAVLALTLPALSGAASFPPHLRFRSLSTGRITVHFHQGLEAAARLAAPLAASILERHEARYKLKLRRVHVVLSDVEDDPNGFALPLPYPIVSVRVAAPDGSDELGNHDGWLRLVLTHELAHIVHLEQARGLLGAGRRVFGRAPFLFPNVLTPTWMIEGLATYEETEATAFGRGRNPDSRMVLRMAAIEGDFPKEDRAVLGLDRWPGGQAGYLFGEAFLRDMTARFGADTLPELARVHAGRVIPYADDLTSRKVTGASFHRRWSEWAGSALVGYRDEAASLRARGLTRSRPYTFRGVRQTSPRFSPDGRQIAYTSGSLSRFRAIRLVRADGTDRRLAERNGGAALSWTPDGATIVFDESEVHRLFATRSDLRAVDVATGAVRKITRGARARDPDVAADGRTIVFVGRLEDRSELFTIALDGSGRRQLTGSEPGTQWSGPRWSPRGDVIVASRLRDGGWLDIVTVDPLTGAVTERTRDRAKDVEPAWTPDGSHVVFRSDRDGVSNLYALRLADGALLRVSNVLGGAFTPDVGRHGRLAFAQYTSRGFDVHVMDLELQGLAPAPPFVEAHPPPMPLPEPETAADRPYRPLPALLPRFWMPYLASAADELQYGAFSGGTDPLFRHAYVLDLHRGLDSGRTGFQGLYQYDRFRPTLLAVIQDKKELLGADLVRTREATLEAALPLVRSVRVSHSAFLAWRRRRETVETGADAGSLDLGGIEAGWVMSSAKRYPYSISPVDGYRLRVAYLKEDPAFGSRLSLAKATADARAYLRLSGENDVLALRLGGGTTFGRGRFTRSFAVGGFPDASLFDLVDTNASVLRGYPGSAFRGRSFAHANAEARFALAHPQRGFRSFPLFLRHLHASLFADAAHAWRGAFRLNEVKTSAGAGLGADLNVGHAIPLTWTASFARGFAGGGETRFYLRVGLAF
jgi:hypothetical protein